MNKIKIYTIGKLRNQNFKNEINEIKKRIKNLEIISIKDFKDNNNNIQIIKDKEEKEIIKYIENKNYNILLSEFGKTFETKTLFDKVIKIDKNINFFINGAFGHNRNLEKNFDLILSLSNLTFTHEMSLLILVEQVYRILEIKRGSKYHK
jgi:23S rRNA (pseudouridine1915-N3)-methyltransferase